MKRKPDKSELELARAIRSLFRSGPTKGIGTCTRYRKWLIEADPELSAFFQLIAVNDGWEDEAARIRQRHAKIMKQSGPYPKDVPAPPPISMSAILELMPVWKEWGGAISTEPSNQS